MGVVQSIQNDSDKLKSTDGRRVGDAINWTGATGGMKQALWWWSRCSCRSRRHWSSSRARSPGFEEALSHCCSRAFHHKTRPNPPLVTLEKFPAATTKSKSNPDLPTNNPSFSSARYSPLLFSSSSCIILRPASIRRSTSYYYSKSYSTLPAMADQVHWTGPRVRQTFLDFFAERGHTIGKAPCPSIYPAMRL